MTKYKAPKLTFSVLFLIQFLSPSAFATLDTEARRGEKTISFSRSSGKPEICVLPRHFEGAQYSKSDLEKEIKLCDMNAGENTAVCEKVNSTNPGLNFHVVPNGMTATQVEARDCEVSGAKKNAKYKLSTSCSYSPSLLAYYHISRILGGAGKVPVAVVRTFDLKKHVQVGDSAISRTAPGSLIRQTWSSLLSQLKSPAASSKKNLLFTKDLDQSYGALQWNPKDEAFYKEFFSGGADGLARAQAFRDRSVVMKALKDSRDLSEIVGRSFNAANLQKAVQMKDASEMIILDTLLNQQDRFGNIHFVPSAYKFDTEDLNKEGLPKLKSKDTPNEEESQGSIIVKKMILKDNDCGVVKTNNAKLAGLADTVKHMDPKTYKKLLKLESVISEASTQEFFTQELLLTNSDFTNIRQNVVELAQKMRRKCQSGDLKLDLDLEAHFSNQPLKTVSCELE